jgi:HAD superfamily hydrolase (TIGR01490 family)
MTLAIFDLDNTLLAGDSDHAWGEFLCERGYVDKAVYQAKNDQFYADYCRGELDVIAYSEFVFSVLAKENPETLATWHAEFMHTKIRAMMLTKGHARIHWHKEQGHTLLIITATNRFITEPIAHAFGIMNILATEPEVAYGQYTGKVAGTPCYQEGKIVRLQEWLAETGEPDDDMWFYSDSRNDIPLLNYVRHPIAVDPDDILRQVATEKAWGIISFR